MLGALPTYKSTINVVPGGAGSARENSKYYKRSAASAAGAQKYYKRSAGDDMGLEPGLVSPEV